MPSSNECHHLRTFSETVHSRSDFFEIAFEFLMIEAVVAVETFRVVGGKKKSRR